MTRQIALVLLLLTGAARFAYAHLPVCDCYDNGDDTITCEGGFTDGGTAAGIPMRILDGAGKLLIEGKMTERSEFTFTKPDVSFSVEFDGGDGHVIKIDGRDIEE